MLVSNQTSELQHMKIFKSFFLIFFLIGLSKRVKTKSGMFLGLKNQADNQGEGKL